MQIKTIMRYHYTSTRMANIWTMMIPKLARIWSNRNSHKLLVGMKNGITTLEDSSALFFYKTKYILTIWSRNCTPWYFLKGAGNLFYIKTCAWMFIATLIITAKFLKQPKCISVGEWQTVVHSDIGYYSALKRNEL